MSADHKQPAHEAPGVESGLYVRFWGVRGSIPCAGRDTLRYGGNTSTVEINAGGHVLVLDGGTGCHELGRSLLQAGGGKGGDVLLSHAHFDHVCGLPFFQPFFVPGQDWRVWSGHLEDGMTTRGLFDELMRPPLFPVSPDIFAADISYRDFRAGQTLAPGPGIVLHTIALNHPNNATGYRVEYGGRAVVYITDVEHVVGQVDAGLVAFARNADVLIYDSTYTDEQFVPGRGHSTWQEGMRIAEAAGVATFVAFHHDPEHNDAFMDDVACALSAARPGSLVAREGLFLKL